MWNDEFPGGEPPEWAGGAHAKGVLGLGTATGFYLLHSVPKFPAAPCMDCPDGIGNGSYTGIALVSIQLQEALGHKLFLNNVWQRSLLLVSMLCAQPHSMPRL